MVFCIIGIVIFGILGIFSAKYRGYFRESIRCIKRQIVLKPCDTDFDNKMKAKIAGKLMRFPRLSALVYKRFLLISWLFIMLMLASIALTGIGVYNWLAYGNCNGQGSSEFCIFNIDSSIDSESVSVEGGVCFDPSMKRELKVIGPGTGNPFQGSGKINVTEFGCYSCPYTKQAEPIVRQMLEKYRNNITFTFRPFPIPLHNNSRLEAEAAYCAWEQPENFWAYHDLIFENQDSITREKLVNLAGTASLDTGRFTACLDEKRYTGKVEENLDDGKYAGIYGTPTFFVNGKYAVGPQSFSDIELLIKEELK